MGSSDYFRYRTWKNWDQAIFGSFGADARLYFEEEIGLCGIRNLRNCNVLEIGFGNGEFAGWATAAGAIYQGTELIPELVALGCAAGFKVTSAQNWRLTGREAQSFDFVFAFDVLEHLSLDELRDLLDLVANSLKVEGRFIARVPSGDSPFSRAIQHGDVTHRTALGGSAIRQLANEAGLAVLAIREPAFPLRGFGVRAFIRRLAVVSIRRLLYPLITLVFMGGGYPVLTPNLVFVLSKR